MYSGPQILQLCQDRYSFSGQAHSNSEKFKINISREQIIVLGETNLKKRNKLT